MRFQRASLALVTILAGHNAVSARETVKEFPSYQCRYTLPGSNWSWVDPVTVPEVVCVARTSDGLVFLLSVLPVPAGKVIDADFVAAFDKTAYPAGGAIK